jgi:hypothetical protein
MNRCNWDWLSNPRLAGAEPFVPHQPPGTIPMQIGQKRFRFGGLGVWPAIDRFFAELDEKSHTSR